jgi:AraC-like DNA-binding protein
VTQRVAPSSGFIPATLSSGDGVRAGMRVVEVERYRFAPVGCCVALRRTLAFCAEPGLWGFSAWSAPSCDDIEQLVSFIALDLAPCVAPHATLVDMRALEAGDLSTFAPLIRHAASHHDIATTKVTRMAVVRPDGLLGMTVAGFFQVVPVPYPVQIFTDFYEAAGWADVRPHLGAALDAQLQDMRRAAPSLGELRSWLDTHITDATLGSAARALARSRRSLQRDLQLSGSSFRAELLDARVRQAKNLLVRTEASLTEIAHDVGCTSLQHFSIMFRARTGETPSRWRDRQRS